MPIVMDLGFEETRRAGDLGGLTDKTGNTIYPGSALIEEAYSCLSAR